MCLGKALINCIMLGKMLSLSRSVPSFIYMKTKSMIIPNIYDNVNSKCVKSRVRRSSAFSIPHYSHRGLLKSRYRSGDSQRSCLVVEKQVFFQV